MLPMLNAEDLKNKGWVQSSPGVWARPKRDNQAGGVASSPIAEQAVCDEPLGAKRRETQDAGRFQVRITSYRRRLLDPDNLVGGCKYFIDCCRRAKIIPDDRQQDIELIVKQEQVKLKGFERTEIEIMKANQ
jgi:Holliday junction resolvase RusA-like endonuclease